MTINHAFEILKIDQAAISRAACFQNPAALEIQAATALFHQKPDTVTLRRLLQAVNAWQQYRAGNPQAEI